MSGDGRWLLGGAGAGTGAGPLLPPLLRRQGQAHAMPSFATGCCLRGGWRPARALGEKAEWQQALAVHNRPCPGL